MVKLILHDYKKYTLVKDDTYRVNDFIENDLRCKWCPRVGPGGWMFPSSRKTDLTKSVEAKGYILRDQVKWKPLDRVVAEDIVTM